MRKKEVVSMRKYAALAVSLLVAFVLLAASSAKADELKLTVGSNTLYVLGVGGLADYSNPNFHGWNLDIVFGISKSPTLDPYGLRLGTITATCVYATPCTNKPLDIYLSDTGFTESVSSFVNGYTATDTGGGSTTQYAWVDTANMLFGEATPIGTLGVGPFTGAGVFASSVTGGGPAGPDAYSLTIEDIFTNPNRVSASFGADGDILSVETPEPVSMLLMGTFLSLAGGLLSKKKRAL
jgi:hypothetical protein